MRTRTALSIEELPHWLNYNPKNGEITWNKPPSNGKGSAKRIPGAVAGSMTTAGYMSVMIMGVNYYWHKLAWALTYGNWPEHTIDHIDKNKLNNRITNLRDVTQEFQQRNRADINVNNTTGYAGVHFRKDTKKYAASIMVNYRQITIGSFDTAEEASAARKNYIMTNNLGYEYRAAQ